jgi:hypothetical protein
MAWRLPGSAEEKYPNRTMFVQCTALITILFWLLLFDACSGFSVPAGGSTAASNSAPSLTISSVLPSAVLGSIYNATLKATGGTAPYAFSLASGQLPTDVLLGATTGTISGTPTTTGSFSFSISVSDSKGLSKQQSLQIIVSNTPMANEGNSFSSLQRSGGWEEYGQGPPNFVDCSPSPCDGISYSMSQEMKSPSMSGESTQYSLGGTADYSDALFNNHLIGDLSSQGMPDSNHALLPTYYNFTYDVYFYGTSLERSQAVEFDINQFFDNMGFIWGHECRIAGGNEWDIWDNVNQHWVPTGISCYPKNNAWNHLTIRVQRTSNNQLLYLSITLNGVTSTLNQYYNPGTTVAWYGVTINFQMDGNYEQSPYTVYLDDLTFTYE